MPSYVVTGASRGIGLEFVRQLSDDRSNEVFALVRNLKSITHLEPLSARKNVHILEADSTSSVQLYKAAEEVSKITGGSLDVLIANAGGNIGSGRSLADPDMPPEEVAAELRENYEQNVVAAVFTNNAFLPLLRKGQQKKIIDISSAMGLGGFSLKTGFAYIPAYSMAKAALNLAVTKYAVELAKENFIVIGLSPGLVDTSKTKAVPPSEEQRKVLAGFIDQWRPSNPDWDGKPLTVEDSVQKQLKVIKSLKPYHSGYMLSQNGDTNQWF
ncbi:hypothetical protein AWJ20_5051 [Sugiyamaella lignohabitans]|uniref:NAD(P)-binding protein n=1 Tax=Sugiyamaella lignohabitans TaxID=796027 RepID=A0A167EHN6_9ASCO|nr:uncharacterized protein AWJ20_5051 [Sugiyamaella lignohabitans]ANB14094.1 hypothetical protein AWJ20_5051 [Sugiyamaella lignohabitans]